MKHFSTTAVCELEDKKIGETYFSCRLSVRDLLFRETPQLLDLVYAQLLISQFYYVRRILLVRRRDCVPTAELRRRISLTSIPAQLV